MVSSNKVDWYQRVFILEKNGNYLCWNKAETIKEAKKSGYTASWKYMKEIERAEITTLTIEDIAKLLNKNPENIRIKK